MYQGLSEDVLKSRSFKKTQGTVQLVFTSPPFALNRKKKYGNKNGSEYIDWLVSYGPLLRGLLNPSGSIVMEMGNAWEPGSPTMSTLSIKALLAFQEQTGLHLCQEFVCYNPARLPGPAAWVTVKRIRVKDAFTRVWWMSPSENPKADNRKVLSKYSDSMRKLLKRGTYNAGKRPSENQIGTRSFLTDHGGAIPPNVLIPAEDTEQQDLFEVLPFSNTRTNDAYQANCRARGLEMHPARMQEHLAAFFIEFLTDPGDLVVDPFAGSNTTGGVAESLGRRWLAIEPNAAYVEGSKARFRSVR